MLQDGMDIGLCKLDVKNNLVEYAGANHSMLLLSNNRITTYKGKRASIGGNRDLESNIFDTYKVTVKKGDVVYLSSDGYTDQFGGPDGRKFMHQQFQQLLLKIAHLPKQEQRDMLGTTLQDWQGDLDQVDDICVVGVKV
jgi:serine phosphatase RsbU (regulator of sigma subunit)